MMARSPSGRCVRLRWRRWRRGPAHDHGLSGPVPARARRKTDGGRDRACGAGGGLQVLGGGTSGHPRESGEMKAAGPGFRREANTDSLREALVAAGGAGGLGVLATASDKADAPVLISLAHGLPLAIKAIPAEHLAGIETPTPSQLIDAQRAIGTPAEAA